MGTIDKVNKEYEKHQEEKKTSDIKPGLDLHHEVKGKDEIEKEKKLQQLRDLSNALGVTQQRDEIDKLNQSVSVLAEKLGEIANSQNQVIAMLNGSAPQTQAAPTESPAMNLDKLELLGGVLEKASDIYMKFKGNQTQTGPTPLIDQNMINQRMVSNFMDNLETGEAITNFIKDSLKKNVTKSIINTSLKDIGRESINHGP